MPQVFAKSQVIDLDGTGVSAQYAVASMTSVAGPNQQVEVQFFDRQGVLLSNKIYPGEFLGSWTNDGRAFLFFRRAGYVEVGLDTLTPYPPDLGNVDKVYDAEEVAVVYANGDYYYSFDPDEGFVLRHSRWSAEMVNVVKRPEGWYTLGNGVLTFDTSSIEVPMVNPIAIALRTDSVELRVDYQGPQNIPVTTYEVSYRLQLRNTADTIIPQIEIQILGPRTSYDPRDPDSYASYVYSDSILSRETITITRTHTYSIAGAIPENKGAIHACIQTVNGQRFMRGQVACRYEETDILSVLTDERSKKQPSIAVFPNPINRTFHLDTDQRIIALKLINASGQTVQEYSHTPLNEYELGEGITRGVYILDVDFAKGNKGRAMVFIQ